MRWPTLLLLAGCGFSGMNPGGGDSDGDGVPIDAAIDASGEDDGSTVDAVLPDGFVPDAFVPDAFVMPDAPPDLDQDDDTIVDADDNCVAIPNPNQWNEDGDDFGDVCDRCPHLTGSNEDADNDLVGNACDPRPNTGGDQLVFFEGFNGGALPSGWTMSGDNHWSVSGGTLRYSTTADAEGIVSVAPAGGLGAQHYVHTGGTITSVTSGNAQVIAVLTDYNAAAPGRFFHCAVSTDRDELELFSYNGSAGNPWVRIDTQPLAVLTGTLYRIVGGAGGSKQLCRNGTLTAEGTVASWNGNRVGLRVRNATAVINYVAVYRTP